MAFASCLVKDAEDESGDFTNGARLDQSAINTIMSFTSISDWRRDEPETDIVATCMALHDYGR